MQIVIKKARNASEITESGTQRITEYASRGFRALGVARGSIDGPISGVQWEAVGLLPLYDPPRHDTGETIRRCIEKVCSPACGCRVCLLNFSGSASEMCDVHGIDSTRIAGAMQQLGIGLWVASFLACCSVFLCDMQGLLVKMITGDQALIGRETAKQLGMGTNIFNTEVLLKVHDPHSITCLVVAFSGLIGSAKFAARLAVL